ncbi:MAG: hypothetical protein Q9227_008906 [Pyrenula ochraceoflavens]
MMIVPRAFPYTSLGTSRRLSHRDKKGRDWEERKDQRSNNTEELAMQKHTSNRLSTAAAAPVRIPSRRHTQPMFSQKPSSIDRSSSSTSIRFRQPPAKTSRASSVASVDTLLASTSIPRPRRLQRKQSQKLPNCDHVAEFSRLLQEDLSTREETPYGSLGNPQFDLIFGSPNERPEEQMIIGSEGVDSTILSTRSISTESMPSLENDTDSATTNSLSDIPASLLPSRKPLPTRPSRKFSTSQECDSDHPLVPVGPPPRSQPDTIDEHSGIPTRPAVGRDRKSSSTFKSNLTASFRAIKNAAQAVSSMALSPPIHHPDDFLTRSIFTIDPSLTDDRRPPRMSEPPSPALRRYFNPTPQPTSPSYYSPSEMHSFSDLPTSNTNPPTTAVQLQTYLPPLHRSPSGSASSPPIFPSASPSPNESNLPPPPSPQLQPTRPREVRENSDFLRIFVCEMAMRRAGKFSEEADGKARIWLPPRTMSENKGPTGKGVAGGKRLEAWSA